MDFLEPISKWKIVLGLLFFLPGTLFSSDKPETLRFEQIAVHRFPVEPPRAFSESLIPPNSRILIGTEFAKTLIDSYTDSSESFVVMESELSMDELAAFYEKFLKENDWKILQKDKREAKAVYLTESSTRRTLAIIIKEEKSKRKIKLYHKRNYSL